MDSFTPTTDKVILRDIQFEAVVGLDVWHRPGKPQPVSLDIHLTPSAGLEAAANEDAVSLTIDYGKLYKALKSAVFGSSFDSVAKLYQAIRSSVPETASWYISISLPKAVLSSRNGIQFTWSAQDDGSGVLTTIQQMHVRDLDCACIIGVNSHERLEKQRLLISITTAGIENRLSQSIYAGVSLDPSPRLVYQDMVQDVVEVCTNHLARVLSLTSSVAYRKLFLRNH